MSGSNGLPPTPPPKKNPNFGAMFGTFLAILKQREFFFFFFFFKNRQFSYFVAISKL